MWQKIKNIYHFLTAFLATIYFHFPSKELTVIGVTGTDGKTTTVNIIYHILKSAGFKVSMVSSVNAQIGTKSYDTGFHVTTPSPWQIQKYLRRAVNSGSKYFVLEATSHGLDQNRLAFVNFEVAVLTNITQDHFDYHKNWQNYALAKEKLFKKAKIAILNLDDNKSFSFLKEKLKGDVISYSKNGKTDINLESYPVKTPIPGDFNLENALAAAAVCHVLKIGKRAMLKSLKNFPGVAGRLEEINLEQPFKVVVDFAHTPNAQEQVLKTLKSKYPGSRLITVFGAAGKRDSSKRPIMGKIASNYADVIILTAEDPRDEEVANICAEIASGIHNKKENINLFIIDDRKIAIKKAISLAKTDDVVVLLGKGHEKSMAYGKKEYLWDEFAAVKDAIKNKLKNGK